MPTISGRISISAGASFQPFVGSQYEFAPYDANIRLALKTSVNLVTCSVFSGPDILAEPGSFVPVGAAEEPPKVPDDYHWDDDVAKGDRLKVTITNGNAGAAITYWVLSITPL